MTMLGKAKFFCRNDKGARANIKSTAFLVCKLANFSKLTFCNYWNFSRNGSLKEFCFRSKQETINLFPVEIIGFEPVTRNGSLKEFCFRSKQETINLFPVEITGFEPVIRSNLATCQRRT